MVIGRTIRKLITIDIHGKRLNGIAGQQQLSMHVLFQLQKFWKTYLKSKQLFVSLSGTFSGAPVNRGRNIGIGTFPANRDVWSLNLKVRPRSTLQATCINFSLSIQ